MYHANHKLTHLAGYLPRQLRCGFNCIATAMQLKPRLTGTSNPGAILRHFMMYKVQDAYRTR